LKKQSYLKEIDRMGYLKTRVKRLEEKYTGESGISKWAMDVAESHSLSEKWRIESLQRLHRAIEESTGIKQPKPRPPELQTDAEKKQYALELSQKYQSYEHYMKSRQSQNIPLTDNLKRVINQFNQEDEVQRKGNSRTDN
jgi:hypothetical protein